METDRLATLRWMFTHPTEIRIAHGPDGAPVFCKFCDIGDTFMRAHRNGGWVNDVTLCFDENLEFGPEPVDTRSLRRQELAANMDEFRQFLIGPAKVREPAPIPQSWQPFEPVAVEEPQIVAEEPPDLAQVAEALKLLADALVRKVPITPGIKR